MQVNPNNPPPQGFGAAFWNWVLSNILYIKRRINGIAANGTGGGSQDLQQVTDLGSTTTNAIHIAGGGDSYISALGMENDSIDASKKVGIAADSSGDTMLYGIIDSSFMKLRFPAAPSGNWTLDIPNASGTIARVEDLSSYVPYTGASQLINVNNQRITTVATPVGMQDATNKSYVDTFVQGLSPKTAVRVATTAALVGSYTPTGGPFTLTALGPLTVDGVPLILNDRILVKNQGDSGVGSTFQNGIYYVSFVGVAAVSSTVLTRATDADAGTELVSAYVITGSEGSANANKGYVQSTASPITVGTTAIVWNLFNSNTLSPGTGIRLAGTTIYNRLSEGVAGGQTAIGGTGTEDTLTLQGSNSASSRTTSAPAVTVSSAGSLGASSGTQIFASVPFTVAQSGTAGYSGLRIIATETSLGSGAKKAIEVLGGSLGDTIKFSVANTGSLTLTDAANINVGAGTGTQIATQTSQKLGFFGATPVAQQSGNILTAMAAYGFGALTLPSGSLIAMRVITNPTTSYTPTSGTTTVVAILVGAGGGGGGGTVTAPNSAVGGGGGGGGMLMVKAAVSTGPYTCAIGTGGAGGTTSTAPQPGSADTTLTIGATTYTAQRGLAGAQGVNSSAPRISLGGTNTATPTNGDVNIQGEAGGTGIVVVSNGSLTSAVSGAGASTPYGSGGGPVGANTGTNIALAGKNGSGYGSGGSGACIFNPTSTPSANGGNGANGVIIIYEYK